MIFVNKIFAALSKTTAETFHQWLRWHISAKCQNFYGHKNVFLFFFCKNAFAAYLKCCKAFKVFVAKGAATPAVIECVHSSASCS